VNLWKCVYDTRNRLVTKALDFLRLRKKILGGLDMPNEGKRLFVPVTDILEITNEMCPACATKLRCKLAESGRERQQVRLSRAGLERILFAVADEAGVSVNDLCSPSRSRTLVAARKKIAVVATEAGYSSTEIGHLLERDHSTILYMLNGKSA
jgi:Bacterial dnaA protein helix-turn-helix